MVTVVQCWQRYHHIRIRRFLWFGKCAMMLNCGLSCSHLVYNLQPFFPVEMCILYLLHSLKYSAYSTRIVESVLSPDCCINPWSFFSFFYSCIECFPQSVASSLHNCLFHSPPWLQHSDGHLSNLLQKVNTNTVRKDLSKYTVLKRNWNVPVLSPEHLRTTQNRPASSWLHIPSEQAISEPSREPVSLPSILEE